MAIKEIFYLAASEQEGNGSRPVAPKVSPSKCLSDIDTLIVQKTFPGRYLPKSPQSFIPCQDCSLTCVASPQVKTEGHSRWMKWSNIQSVETPSTLRWVERECRRSDRQGKWRKTVDSWKLTCGEDGLVNILCSQFATGGENDALFLPLLPQVLLLPAAKPSRSVDGSDKVWGRRGVVYFLGNLWMRKDRSGSLSWELLWMRE